MNRTAGSMIAEILFLHVRLRVTVLGIAMVATVTGRHVLWIGGMIGGTTEGMTGGMIAGTIGGMTATVTAIASTDDRHLQESVILVIGTNFMAATADGTTDTLPVIATMSAIVTTTIGEILVITETLEMTGGGTGTTDGTTVETTTAGMTTVVRRRQNARMERCRRMARFLSLLPRLTSRLPHQHRPRVDGLGLP